MRIYIMSSKIFHAAFIITFHVCSGAPQCPFPPESFLIYILFLCRIETRNLLATLNLEDLGSRTCNPHKCLELTLLHIIQFGSQVIIHDLFSLGTVLLLCNSFLFSKQWLPDKLQLHKITQASEIELTDIGCCPPTTTSTVVKYEVH